MTDYHVTCINKPNRQSTHEHITHIGNVAAAWRLTRDAAIRRIDSGADRFYTLDARGNPMYVGVVREPGRHAYLRTHADNQWNDNLLAQQECPGTCEVVE